MDTQEFDALVAQYGSYIAEDGTEYCLRQHPHWTTVAGYSNAYMAQGESYYLATAYDRDGNQVTLIWEIVNPETEDESEVCDWSKFVVKPRG